MMNYLKKLRKNFPVNFARLLLFIYHGIFPSSNRICRFEPTCSQYLLDSLRTHGTLKGLYLTLKRLLACHPFSTRDMFDPTP